MFITEQWLRRRAANCSGLDFYIQGQTTDFEIQWKRFWEAKRYDDLGWFLSRKLDRKNNIRYALFAAEKALPDYESKYPKDNIPRLAIEAAKKVLVFDNEKNREKAAVAAYAAGPIHVGATCVAAVAAYDITVANYASYVSYTAATYADTLEAGIISKKEILIYGKKLLKRSNKRK